MKEKNTNEELFEIIGKVAPGTVLRDGLENILKAGTGGLIVVSDSEEVLDLTDGGFKINDEFTPAKVYELAKLDNAIVISTDAKKILLANTQLLPDRRVTTVETGSRHRTAERIAKQTGELVICISQRRGVITLYKGNIRYVLQNTSIVLNKTNQALQTLEKLKFVFDRYANLLNEYEFDDIVMLDNVIVTIQRAEMVLRMVFEIEKSIVELGTEGRLLAIQLEEILENTELVKELIIKDYYIKNKKNTYKDAVEEIEKLEYEDLMTHKCIAKILGYEDFDSTSEVAVQSKGYRVLNKIPKMPSNIIDNLVKKFKTLNGLLDAGIDDLDEVDGIGEVRAQTINQTLRRMREQYLYFR